MSGPMHTRWWKDIVILAIGISCLVAFWMVAAAVIRHFGVAS